MTNVKIVDTISPLINETAIGVNIGLPESTSGIRPITVVVVVRIIGLNLLSTASIQASSALWPSFLAVVIYSISRIALLTTTPKD